MSDDPGEEQLPRIGRAPATSRAELTNIGLDLFYRHGFDETTVDDIAQAAGIGRRTFFRYFASKNDVPWGDFDGLVERMREHLDAVPLDVPPLVALRDAVLEFNRFPDVETGHHRQRMQLLLHVPSLIGHSTLRFRTWREAVADFVAARTGCRPEDLRPQTVAWTYLAATIAAYERWLRVEDEPLDALIVEAMDDLDGAFPGRDGA